uniref:cytochrome b-c1 complex subunit Rieske, mitochondrial n=1 Tax=Myxine glutinosa TaxID=7769 RepID=UPI00358E3D9D
MLGIAARFGAFSPYASATSSVVACSLRPLAAIPAKGETPVMDRAPVMETSYALNALIPRRTLRGTSRLNTRSSVRFYHGDVKFPDYSEYRRVDVQDCNKSSQKSSESRKAFTYLMSGGAAVASVYGAKLVVKHLIDSISASKDVLALAKIEVSLKNIPEGRNLTVKWRGKPVFLRHRTAAEIASDDVHPSLLRHCEDTNDRTVKPEWLIVVGICTHLGCIPISHAGEYGGFFCPCHGSHYDSLGRIRKGPAPLNLEVPLYEFVDESTVVVG